MIFGRHKRDQVMKDLLLDLLQVVLDAALSLFSHMNWFFDCSMSSMQFDLIHLSLSLIKKTCYSGLVLLFML